MYDDHTIPLGCEGTVLDDETSVLSRKQPWRESMSNIPDEYFEDDPNELRAIDQLYELPYCDYCEHEGHTFRSCPKRDDTP